MFTAETEREDLQKAGGVGGNLQARNLNYSDIPPVISSHQTSVNHLGNSESSLQWHSQSRLTATFPLASAINPPKAGVKNRNSHLLAPAIQ